MAKKGGAVSCGRDLTCVPDLQATLTSTGDCGFDFVVSPLVHPRYKREWRGSGQGRPGPTTRSDKVLSGTEWSSYVVGKVSPWIHLDSVQETVRRNSEKAFEEELTFASHVSVPAVYIPLKSGNCTNLSRCLGKFLHSQFSNMFWILVPMVSPRSILEGVDESVISNEKEEEDDPWEWWNKLNTLCGSSRKLGVALEVSVNLPRAAKLRQWCGEPVKAVVLSTDIFLTNKKGYPVLSRAHQLFLYQMFKLNAQLILRGACKVNTGIHSYLQYLNYLYQNQPVHSSMDTFAKGYDDFLQSPLQPLMDNLESATYEIFEKDPVKYAQYEKAIQSALLSRVTDEEKEDKVIVLMVVGAGRGPLVDAALKASVTAERLVKVYAVEKNPGAVNTLLNRQAEEWGEQVTIISSDMRKWRAPEKADILISELLGSFGDNELSPECLDGAQIFLKADGISIPCSYTSYLAPLSSPKLHTDVGYCKDKDKAYPFSHFETPYVVRLSNVNVLGEPLPCFTFKHPNYDDPIINERYISLRFQVPESTTIHGFAGYFDTELHDGITLSIVPNGHSDGMISWFPIYFPIQNPMYVPASCYIQLHIWRLCSSAKVWYEWCVTEPQVTGMHNPNGRSYWIGL